MDSINKVNHPVVFFDGVCNLCSSSVQFIIKNDKKHVFRFASLQSDYAKTNLPSELTKDNNYQSFVLKMNNKLYKKSTAALTIAKYLTNGLQLLYFFMIVPTFVRDAVYSLIAKNRYKIFGKKDACMIPTPELKSLFLD